MNDNNNNIEELARKMAEQMFADMLKQQASANLENNTKKTEKLPILNAELSSRVDKFFEKLEKFFPEHKVFALDSIDKTLREHLSELYKKIGYNTADEMLNAYGYELISGNAVKELRSFVLYTPGNEPEIIKNKVENMCNLLNEYYKDKIIPRGIRNDHKHLASTISGLYQWLGYKSAGEMLAAYGFQYLVETDHQKFTGGRPSADYDSLINLLIEKYKNQPKPASIGALIFDNPEYRGRIKTLQNKSQELFGMTLVKYFTEIGLLAKNDENSFSITPTASTNTNQEILAELTELYQNTPDVSEETIEKLQEKLKAFTIKKNKDNKICITKVNNYSEHMEIPYGIQALSKDLFIDIDCLKTIIIPSTIEEIPDRTFFNCTNLEKVELKENLIHIGKRAFYNCRSLTEINLPSTVEVIEILAFAECQNLEKINLNNKYTDIAKDAFLNCKTTIDTHASYIYDGLIYTLNKNRNIVITKYQGCDEIIEIPETIDNILVEEIESEAFSDQKTIVKLTMPDSIKTIGTNTFKDCISLKSIHLSNNISKLYSNIFNGCISLEEINIPDAVTELKKNTFAKSPIKSLHIGKNLATISTNSFSPSTLDNNGKVTKTRNITKIDIDPMNPFLKTESSLVFSYDKTTILAALANNSTYQIPEGVEVIAENAFNGLTKLTDITLPESLKVIEKKAFYFTHLRHINFNSNLKIIGEAAFDNCSLLSSVIFNEGLEVIENRAFEGCPIVSIFLPSTVKQLGKYCFSCFGSYYEDKIKEFKIADNNPYYYTDGIGLYELRDNYKKILYTRDQKNPNYTVADGTTHISKYAFSNKCNLKEIILPSTLIEIEDNAFENCSDLKQLDLPESLKYIGSHAFKGTMIKNLTIPSNIEHIGTGAFSTGQTWDFTSKRVLKSLKISKQNPIYYIENKTLYKRNNDGTLGLLFYFGDDAEFFIKEGVTEIYNESFYKSIIEQIHIPSTVKNIEEQAFSKCSKLNRLYVEFAQAENGIKDAVIYIPEIENKGYFSYEEQGMRNQFLDCIRIDENGNIFDFVKYDSLFETITNKKARILIATDRLKSAIQLFPIYREKYLNYLQKNAKKAVDIVIEYDDLSGLNILAELNVFTGKNIDEVIELANTKEKTEILSYLMNFKNSNIGINESNYDL